MGRGWWFAENASGTSLPSQKVVQKLAAEVWKRLPGTKSARSCTEQACITELVDKILMMELARCYIYDFCMPEHTGDKMAECDSCHVFMWSVIHAMFGITATLWIFPVRCLGVQRFFRPCARLQYLLWSACLLPAIATSNGLNSETTSSITTK